MKRQKTKPAAWLRGVAWTIAALAILHVVLLIPEKDFEAAADNEAHPFVWDQDQIWASLEAEFQKARTTGCDSLMAPIDSGLAYGRRIVGRIAGEQFSPDARIFDSLEAAMFGLAAEIAACPDRLPEYIELYRQIRSEIKDQSRQWDMGTIEARHRLYRLLYGGRAAVEEIMLQAPQGSIPALVEGGETPSATPQAEILGITIHSGDILVSRGGAPTSALIARGNDYPGNFSHVALAYVDDKTGEVTILESHIESGVGPSSIDKYIADTKLRVMVLRLRSDLPQLIADPMLPHKAASAMLEDALTKHIPYDFAMDFADDGRLFCSEVASSPYRKEGIRLWMGISRISSLRLRLWLAALGVRHFETQEPSDLEYDPQLEVVAEWRDPALLFYDHLDNAVLDALLEGGDTTLTLDYNRYALPMARCIKGYSMIKNLFGAVGPIPEGMSATAALRIDKFSQKHAAIKSRLKAAAEEFRSARGYTPPYWVLVRLAEEAKTEDEASRN